MSRSQLVLTDTFDYGIVRTMGTIEPVFQLIHRILKDNLLLYDVYLHMSSHLGIHKILTSTVDKTKEILRVIEVFEADPTPLEQRFNEVQSLDLRKFEAPLSFDGYSSFSDSLRTLLQRERLVLELLELLLNLSRGENEKVPLHSLVEQTRRHIRILQDRLDLESMLTS